MQRGRTPGLWCCAGRTTWFYATFPWELCAYDDVVCFMAPNFENGGVSLGRRRTVPCLSFPHVAGAGAGLRGKRCRCSISVISCAPTYLEGEKWILATYWSADPAKDLRVFLYSKAEKRHWVGRDFRNDVDRRGVGIRTAYTDNNTLVTWEENKDPDRNPVVGILQLK